MDKINGKKQIQRESLTMIAPQKERPEAGEDDSDLIDTILDKERELDEKAEDKAKSPSSLYPLVQPSQLMQVTLEEQKRNNDNRQHPDSHVLFNDSAPVHTRAVYKHAFYAGQQATQMARHNLSARAAAQMNYPQNPYSIGYIGAAREARALQQHQYQPPLQYMTFPP
jgi:hypothetical protein